MKKKIIPIVFTTDNVYVKFLCVSINSIITNNKGKHILNFYVFHNGLSEENCNALNLYNQKYSKIILINVNDKIDCFIDKVCVRDNYTQAIYYRFLIPEILKDFDKAIYLDCDIVLKDDIYKLYKIKLRKKLLGAVSDEAVNNSQLFINYTKNYLGIREKKYFNSGVLLLNCKLFRKEKMFDKFLSLINTISFKVAPDQDYLNILCKDRVKYLKNIWNKMPLFETADNEEKIKLIHYNLNYKPWRFENIKYSNYFWKYAKSTPFYSEIVLEKDNYVKENKEKKDNSFKNLIKICEECVNKCTNYLGVKNV